MNRTLALALCLVLPVLVVGCDDKPKPAPADATPTAPGASTPAPAASPAPVASSAAPAASGSAPSAAAGAADGTWSGTGKSKVAEVAVPKDAHVEVWKKDAGGDGVGDVTLKLTVAGRTVKGEIGGALGPGVVSGDLDAGVLTGRVDPKDPNQPVAWTGMLSGKVEGGALAVKVRVSDRTANRAREVELKLAK